MPKNKRTECFRQMAERHTGTKANVGLMGTVSFSQSIVERRKEELERKNILESTPIKSSRVRKRASFRG
jgi:hypothetical protein